MLFSADEPEQAVAPAAKPGGWLDRFKVRPGSVAGCAFNLCSATLGAGSLSLPYAFRCSGLVLALVLLVLGALSTVFSIFLLVEARRLTGKQSYEELAHFLFGKRFEWLVEFAIILFCFGTAAAYIIAIGDILEPVAEAIGVPSWFNRYLLMCAFWALVMFPLSMVEKVNSLTWTSLMGVISITFLVIAAAFHAFQTIGEEGWRTGETTYFNGGAQLLLGAPIVMFAFTCQVNVFSIQNELQNPTPQRMSRVVVGSVCTSLTIYAFMGLFGYLDFLGETPGNILKKYELQASNFVDILIDMAFLAITITVVVAFPLNIFPCRFALESLVFGGPKTATATEQQDLLTDEARRGSADYGSGTSDRQPKMRRGDSGSSIQASDDQVDADGGVMVIDSSFSQKLLGSHEAKSAADGLGPIDIDAGPAEADDVNRLPVGSRGWLRGAFMRHFMLTFVLCGGALAVAIALPSLNFAFQLLGGLCSSFLCFALPGMYIIRIASQPERFVSPELGVVGPVADDEDLDGYLSPTADGGFPSLSSAPVHSEGSLAATAAAGGVAGTALPSSKLIGGFVKPSHYWGSWALIISGGLLGLGATSVTIAGLWVDSLKEED